MPRPAPHPMPHVRSTMKILLAIVVVAIILGFSFLGFVPGISETIQTKIGVYPFLGPFIYMGVVMISIVIMPINTMPLVPFATKLWGPIPAALYAIIGWTIGAVIAFFIARYLGRPVLQRFVSLEKLERWEKQIPQNIEFIAVVLLRMAIPVDILSYALGVFTKISIHKYMLATLIGVAPFSFIWAYAGNALILGNYLAGAGLLLFIAIALLILRRFLKRNRRLDSKPNSNFH